MFTDEASFKVPVVQLWMGRMDLFVSVVPVFWGQRAFYPVRLTKEMFAIFLVSLLVLKNTASRFCRNENEKKSQYQ